MHVTSIYGVYREGDLVGEAAAFATRTVATGGQVSIQGPEWSNRNSPNVLVLYRDSGRRGGWFVWGRTSLAKCTCPAAGEEL